MSDIAQPHGEDKPEGARHSWLDSKWAMTLGWAVLLLALIWWW
jgi:hypothetical protein